MTGNCTSVNQQDEIRGLRLELDAVNKKLEQSNDTVFPIR